MDEANFIRIKLEFRTKVKVVKLDRRVDTALSSMANLRKLIFKNFSEVGEMVEAPGGSGATAMDLTVKCLDSAGGFVNLENEKDLEVSRENLSMCNDLSFQIDVVRAGRSTAAEPSVAPAIRKSRSAGSTGFRFSDRTDARPSAMGDHLRKEQVCRYFERGHCKNGPTCQFSHESTRNPFAASSSARRGSGRGWGLTMEMEDDSKSESCFMNVRAIDNWLMKQLSFGASENIEHLSGDKGLRALSQVVERRNLPNKTIELFVKLLVKDDVRTSLLRQKTNKIYGVLRGSPFLLHLRGHITSDLENPTRTPKAQDVRPYVLLAEELQLRTADGWKEVPLDALQSVVSRLEPSASKNELVTIVSRLLDQREELTRLPAVAPRDKCLQGAQFRQVSIVPGKEEFLRDQAAQDLPIIGMRYPQVSDYVETHFQLLREDCVEHLRHGIKEYILRNRNETTGNTKSSERSIQEVHVYTGVQHSEIRCGSRGVEHVFWFDLHGRDIDIEQLESSNILKFDNLLCISSDEFQTFFWGVVSWRQEKQLSKGLVSIRIIGESDANVTAGLQSGQTSTESYVVIEPITAYFGAYYYVLKSLQREELERMPFTPYLLHLEPRVRPPSYLLRRKKGDNYDFSCAFPDIQLNLGSSSIRITQSEWPSGWADSLDTDQQDALRQALTKELAIIQGPPGTGKTFLGLILIKILLANLKYKEDHNLSHVSRMWIERSEGPVIEERTCDLSGPILVICYTNHALDQFLEGIYRNGETNLIRIGGQSKSDLLKNKNLKELLNKQRVDNEVERSHRRFFAQGRREKAALESDIHECINVMGTKHVTGPLLDGVATTKQIESLFFTIGLPDGLSQKVVELWLNEERCVDPYYAHNFLVNEKYRRVQSPTVLTLVAQSAEKLWCGQMKPMPKVETDQDGDRIQERRRRGLRQAPLPGPLPNADSIAGEEPIDEKYRLEDFVDAPNVWQLNLLQRSMLHDSWMKEIRMNHRRRLRQLTHDYEDACQNLTEVENAIQLFLLRKANVVGITTTAAAKYHGVLEALKPEIIVVEEAAEVLEGQILACLSSSVNHLILIGDHLQLRPFVAVHRLAAEHKLDVSMFERLVSSGVEHVTLQEQRRMRPSISKLMKSLYPRSRDHESVKHYEAIKGVNSNVFFFDHKADDGTVRDAARSVNSTEAKLVVELYRYLLSQGCYKPENIAILSMYSGQVVEIETLLSERSRSKWYRRAIGEKLEGQEPDLPRVSTVDDYQGEESDIILLSLVRSNAIIADERVHRRKVGFLSTPNRTCVALTRARQGLFIFGNADFLAEKSTLWNDLTTSMRDDGELGPELELYCQNHPDTITKISVVEDFKQVEDGGCSLPCESQLDCGHACPRRCHPGSHDLVVCPQPCLKQYDNCPHVCNLQCHGPSGDCPPCVVMVTKQIPHCGHQQGVECSTDVTNEVCRSDCPKLLQCGHRCATFCGRPCTNLCTEKEVKMLPCGHSASMSCHQHPATYPCDKPCTARLQDCQHQCGGKCGLCKQDTAHIPCQKECGRILPCGHLCQAGCYLTCPPCLQRCQKRCFHSRCSKPCGNVCEPCREPCSWQCEHHKCMKRCHEICTRPRCEEPCRKLISECGHRCIGVCGEPCPTKCRVCHPETKDVITLMTLEEYEDSDKFVQLEDCNHIFEVSGFDNWMDSDETAAQPQDGSVAIKLKECPECRIPIWRSHRYSNVVKKKHFQVEDAKKKIRGQEKTRQGNLLLEQYDEVGALSAFLQALYDDPGLMEAHFGTGRAFCVGREYTKAITHLSFIVERSSFSSALAKLITRTRGRGHAVGFVEKFYGSSTSEAGDSIAKQAIVQWTVALLESREFDVAIELCDAVLERDPDNQPAAEMKAKAEKWVVQLVAQVTVVEVGERGH